MKQFTHTVARIKNASGEFEPIPALRGATSYEIAKRNGFTGTEEDWYNLAFDEGWVTKYQELEANKVDKTQLDDYYTSEQTDELLEKTKNDCYSQIDMSSYHAFVAATNSDTLDAAFGKNNEDLIVGIGRQLAMYAWFKGTDKTEYPFLNLIKMSKLSDMDINSFEEIAMDSYLPPLIKTSPYASDMFVFDDDEIHTTGTGSKTHDITVTDEDLERPFYMDVTLNAGNISGSVSLTIGTKVYEITNGYETFTGFMNWSDIGITSAGTYTITMKSVSSSGGSSINSDVWFSMIRMKG